MSPIVLSQGKLLLTDRAGVALTEVHGFVVEVQELLVRKNFLT